MLLRLYRNGAAEFGLSTLQRRNDEERPVADAAERSAFVNLPARRYRLRRLVALLGLSRLRVLARLLLVRLGVHSGLLRLDGSRFFGFRLSLLSALLASGCSLWPDAAYRGNASSTSRRPSHARKQIEMLSE